MVAISGMEEIPKNCFECPILCKEDGQCEVSKEYIYGNNIPSDCPLVEIITCKDCKNRDKCRYAISNNDYAYCSAAVRK